jgi:hypothetical protein
MFVPIPDDVHNDMRTIDPIALSDGERDLAAMEMLRRSVPVVQEIERAAQGCYDPATKETCLAFVEAQNELTGAWARLVCRRSADGSYSRPLAELLARDPDWTPETRDTANALGRTAGDGKLLLVAYKERDESPHRAVFACVGTETDNEHLAWTFLARLLVTPFEIAQWSDPMTKPAERILH